MNTPGFREVELKFRIDGSIEDIIAFHTKLELYVESSAKVLHCKTLDRYYKVPGKAQFGRLRHSWGTDGSGKKRTLKEFTVKQKDRGSNLNRLEVNLPVEDLKLFRKAIGLALGKPTATVYKDFEWVAFLRDGSTLSIAKIRGGAWFLEVEAASATLVRRYKDLCYSKAFYLTLTPEPKSLFELYVEGSL